MNTQQKSLSVVVVSDFEASEQKTWKDEISMAKAIAAQDIRIPFEVIFVESTVHQDVPIPGELKQALPDTQFKFVDSIQSAEMKDVGIEESTGDWVAVMEADCVPESNWLRLLAKAAEQNPEMDAISGRTHYGNESSYKRVMTLIDRTFNDSGKSREAKFVSNNGALCRRSMLLENKFPQAGNPFLSARLRNIRMHKAGYRFYFERDALIRHEIGGIGFIIDQHKNYAYMEAKITDCNHISKILPLVMKMFVLDLKRYRWLGQLYLRWFDWPLALFLVIFVRFPEALGCYYAVKDVDVIPNTAYR